LGGRPEAGDQWKNRVTDGLSGKVTPNGTLLKFRARFTFALTNERESG
jgi:hypothetical protein